MESYELEISQFAERDLLETLFDEGVSSPSSGSSDEGTMPEDLTVLFHPDLVNPLLNATAAYQIQKRPLDPNITNFVQPFSDEDEPSAKRFKDAQNKKEADRVTIQREASRRYRKKQKDLIEKLEQQLKASQMELNKAKEQNVELQNSISKITLEKQALKKASVEESQKIERDRTAVMFELEKLFAEDAPDQVLVETLDRLDNLCAKVVDIGNCHWQLLISPNFVNLLVKSDFFDRRAAMTQETMADTGGLTRYAKRLLESVKDLSSEQTAKIYQLVDDYYAELKRFQAERERVDEDVRTLFAETAAGKRDIAKKIQIVGSLELLRKNLFEEADLVEQYYGKMNHVLTIRQRAKFYIEVEYHHKTVLHLKNMWDSIRQVAHK